jgi:catechol 2,3-dioxygenase-like lactoylglutathione lyase family enzyme
VIARGTTFQTVLTDGVELFGAGTRDRNFFMYLDGPDHVTIEVQSAMHHDFMHVHLFSDNPVAAAAWYEKHLGVATRTKLDTVRAFRGIPTGPAASMQLDAVTIWIYPTAHVKALYGGQWKGRTGYASNRGRALDHVAFSVDDLDATLARLKSEGVTIVSGPRKADGVRSAFIEAPVGWNSSSSKATRNASPWRPGAKQLSRASSSLEGMMRCTPAAASPAPPALAQGKAAFEVASIRAVDDPSAVRIGFQATGSQVRIAGMSVKDLLITAYGLKPQQIEGPDWIGQLRFSVTATIPDGVPVSKTREMLQTPTGSAQAAPRDEGPPSSWGVEERRQATGGEGSPRRSLHPIRP